MVDEFKVHRKVEKQYKIITFALLFILLLFIVGGEKPTISTSYLLVAITFGFFYYVLQEYKQKKKDLNAILKENRKWAWSNHGIKLPDIPLHTAINSEGTIVTPWIKADYLDPGQNVHYAYYLREGVGIKRVRGSIVGIDDKTLDEMREQFELSPLIREFTAKEKVVKAYQDVLAEAGISVETD